jgi:biopolymer transport protein ExbD
MTTFMNLMVVLVPFLLITAVFSRITIVELDLPSATGARRRASRPSGSRWWSARRGSRSRTARR